MAQITWRNVANTVTGNPAAALSAASSAFANVGVRSDKMLQAAIARDELAQKNLTDDATQRIFGKGELAGIDKGADFGAILKDYQAGKLSEADIARAKSAGALDEEQIRVSTEKNTLEAFAADRELAATKAGTAATSAETASQVQARLQQAADEERAISDETDSINTARRADLAEMLEPYQAEVRTKIKEITLNPDMEDIDKTIQIDKITARLAGAADEMDRSTQSGWLAMYKLDNQDVSRKALEETGVFKQDAIARERQEEREDTRVESEIAYKQRQGDVLEGIANGLPANLNMMIPDVKTGKPIPLTNSADIRANTMNKDSAYEFVKSKNKGWWNADWAIDETLPDGVRKKVDSVLAEVGGNRALFKLVMEDIKYDSEMWAGSNAWVFGSADEIHNLPIATAVQAAVKPYQDAARTMWEQQVKPKARPNSAVEDLIKILQSGK